LPPRINKNKCTGCGICVFHCGVDALALTSSGEKAKLVDHCVDCFICEAVCPEDAIKIVLYPKRAPKLGRSENLAR
jgi:Pyruvate/2-oxoacid:ferredoxin oxidoreductase delta subunit